MAKPTNVMLSAIKTFDTKSLKQVDTEITTMDGKKLVERASGDSGRVTEQVGSGAPGYCIDTTPDMNVGVAMDGLLVSSQDVAHDKEKLTELGVTHIVNVASGVPNSFPGECEYLTEEMFDDNQQRLVDHYKKIEAFIDAARSSQGKVLVHCNAGRSRSASIALAYVIHKNKITLAKALEQLQQTRPVAQPNASFMEQLQEMEKSLAL